LTGRNRYRALAALPALTLALSATACVESANSTGSVDGGKVQLVEAGKLLTCSHLPYVPFEYRDSAGKIVGFDIDLVDLVAKKLGVTQQVIDTPFDGIQSGADLEANQCDVVAGAISITPPRAANFTFSTPYFHATQALLTRKGSGFASLDNLRGKNVGVQTGTTGENYLKDYNARTGNTVTAVAFEDSALLETAVKTGQVEAAINDNGIFYDYVRKNSELEVSNEFDTTDQYGFGVRKINSALLAEINTVLTDSAKDGSYARIYQTWFGKQPTWMPGKG